MDEAEKFGVDAVLSRDGSALASRVVVANYERLHYFDPDRFGGVVCDESSILKNFAGERRGPGEVLYNAVDTEHFRPALPGPRDSGA